MEYSGHAVEVSASGLFSLVDKAVAAEDVGLLAGEHGFVGLAVFLVWLESFFGDDGVIGHLIDVPVFGMNVGSSHIVSGDMVCCVYARDPGGDVGAFDRAVLFVLFSGCRVVGEDVHVRNVS